mgnify:CR=1 FL=1|tara:strand:+ start:1214 stop:1531 length:318 start_codon:yes stop_codon:yes gene_type:complete
MEQKAIIRIIKSKDNWDSKELVAAIKAEEKKVVRIKFCRIGGYESLRDGTQTEVCKSLEDVQNLLDDWDIEYDETITDPYKLADSIELKWEDMFDDGGGSGWIKY